MQAEHAHTLQRFDPQVRPSFDINNDGNVLKMCDFLLDPILCKIARDLRSTQRIQSRHAQWKDHDRAHVVINLLWARTIQVEEHERHGTLAGLVVKCTLTRYF